MHRDSFEIDGAINGGNSKLIIYIDDFLMLTLYKVLMTCTSMIMIVIVDSDIGRTNVTSMTGIGIGRQKRELGTGLYVPPAA